jgi:hypothetical protein
MSSRWLTVSLVVFGFGAVTIGCGGNSPRPPMGKVSGKVTYDGTAVNQGRVTFTPVTGDGDSGGTSAMGVIESDGSYSLTTFNTGDGALVGQHIVTVVVPTEDIRELNKPRPDGSIPYILPKELVPKRYTDPKLTPLRYTVEAGQNSIDIPLSSKK